jgi:hypothetical protein
MTVVHESAEGRHLTIAQPTRARAIRRAHAALGRSPSPHEAGEHSPLAAGTWANYRGSWDAILRADAGLPGHADLVAGFARERYESRHPWQDSVSFRAGDVAAAVDLHAGYCGRLLAAIERGERHADALDGLAVTTANRNTNGRLWEVRR